MVCPHDSANDGRRTCLYARQQTQTEEDAHVEGTGDDAFDLLLNNPDVPETMKLQLRKSRDSMLKAATPPEPKKEE